jgi:hypothetical protein
MGVEVRSSEPLRRSVREWREKSEGSKFLPDDLVLGGRANGMERIG